MAYNPAAKDAGVTLSNSDRTATRTSGSGNGGMVLGFGGKSTGKWYVEFVIGTNINTAVGVSAASLPSYLGSNTTSWGYWFSGNRWFNASPTAGYAGYTTGDVIGVAWNASAGEIWWSKNGVWQGGGDPAAGTSPGYTGVTGTLYPAANVYDALQIVSIRNSTSNGYPTPSGFTNWTL